MSFLSPQESLIVDRSVLIRYVTGRATSVEAQAVSNWAAADPEHQRQLDTERVAWTAVHESVVDVPYDIQKGWTRFQSAAVSRRQTVPPVGEFRGRSGWSGMVSGVAALLVMGIWIVRLSLPFGTSPSSVRDIVTPAGAYTTVTLRDGTRLTLGPMSRLQVPSDFGRGARLLTLDGEAVFSVVHDSRRPFVVHTVYGDTRDLGTVFEVRAYRGDETGQVSVSEGSVSVSGTTLYARDVALLNTRGLLTVRRHTDLTPFSAWIQGALAFSDTPLRDVARELGRRFNLEVTIPDSALASQHLTGRFTDLTADAILEDITAAAGAEYHRVGRTVVIRPAKSQPTRTAPVRAPSPVVVARSNS